MKTTTIKKFSLVLIVGMLAALLMIVCTTNKSYANEDISNDIVHINYHGNYAGCAKIITDAVPRGTELNLREQGSFKCEGSEFLGWNTSSNITGDFYGAGQTIVADADLELYAEWNDPKAPAVVSGCVDFGATGQDMCTLELIDLDNHVVTTKTLLFADSDFTLEVNRNTLYQIRVHNEYCEDVWVTVNVDRNTKLDTIFL